MDKETMLKYAPWLLVALIFFMQYNIFVTPVQMEQTRRDILKEVEMHYATKESNENLKAGLTDMKAKIDKIYDILNNTANRR